MKWTSEPPAEAGFYHWRQDANAPPVVVQVRLGEGMNKHNLRMYLAGNDNSFWPEMGEWWPAPIAAPVEA